MKNKSGEFTQKKPMGDLIEIEANREHIKNIILRFIQMLKKAVWLMVVCSTIC